MKQAKAIEENPRVKRRWYRIRWRTVLVFTGICVVVLGVSVALKIQTARRQKEAVATIENLGGYVDYDAAVEGPAWLKDFVANVDQVLCQNMDDTNVSVLGDLPRLKSLNLIGSRVTNTGLKNIVQMKELKSLENLNLSSTRVTGAGLAPLKELPRLRGLHLSDTALMCAERTETEASPVIANAFQKLFQVPVHVKAISKTPTDAGVALLGSLRQLETLNVRMTHLTDAGVAYLTSLKQLEWLALNDNPDVTDRGLVHIGGLTRLRYLDLSNTGITDSGLTSLAGLRELEELGLRSTKISDSGLEHLKALHQLKSLDLVETKVTDAGLEKLKALHQLKSLDLAWTKVTDGGLEHLEGLTELRNLDVEHTKVTGAGVKRLQKALPRCKIDHQPNTALEEKFKKELLQMIDQMFGPVQQPSE